MISRLSKIHKQFIKKGLIALFLFLMDVASKTTRKCEVDRISDIISIFTKGHI